jgi:OmpA-OmpF porin, OOP family
MSFFRASRFVLVPALALFASVSHAQGPYVGGGLHLRRYDLSQPGAQSGDAATGHSLSGKLFAGYDFNDAWAVEGGYVDLGEQAYSYALDGTAGRLSTQGHAWFGAVKASMPLNEKFGLFGKLGLDRLRFESTGSGAASSLARKKTSTAVYLGAGVQYKVSKNLAATLELERFGAEKRPGGDLTGLSLSLKYGF